MSVRSRKFGIHQLDRTLSGFYALRETPRPKNGWIKAIRTALGMSARQLGARAGMGQVPVSKIEERERLGTVTMATMDKMARALDCTFVYALVPNTSLDGFIRDRAEEIARRRVLGTAHSMKLEKQAVGEEETREQIALLTEEIMATLPRHMWNSDGVDI